MLRRIPQNSKNLLHASSLQQLQHHHAMVTPLVGGVQLRRSPIDTTTFWEQQQLLARSLHIIYYGSANVNASQSSATAASAASAVTAASAPRAASYATDESGFDDDFKSQPKLNIEPAMQEMMNRIDGDVKNNPVVLYMKGTPLVPQCGFSRAVVQVLGMYGYRYIAFNMNEDILMKESLKRYTNWYTIPQLFVKGEFIGGCDIVLQLHREGKLGPLLADSGSDKVQP